MATMREEIHRERHWQPEVVDATGTSTALKATQVIYYVLAVLEGLLLFRFAFKLFAANPSNDFVQFIYAVTSPFVAPFQGIFATPAEAGSVFESATLLAMVVYALLAYIIARLFFVSTEGTETLDSEIR
jgi:hypothetical protein